MTKRPDEHIPIAIRMAVEDLLTEFAYRVDNGLSATVDELFTDDGSIETPQFTLQGRAAIHERFAARARDATRKTRHTWSNPRYSGDETEVKVTTNAFTTIATPDSPAILICGSSIDVIVPSNGGWAFRSRRLVVIFEGTLPPLEHCS